jgi:hypothetical protein
MGGREVEREEEGEGEGGGEGIRLHTKEDRRSL